MQIPFLKKPPATSHQPLATGPSPTVQFAAGITTIQDILAPDAIEVDFSHIKIGNKYVRTLFVAGYPRFVTANWLSPLINFDHSLDIAMYIYPIEGKGVLEDLRRKITEMEAEINSDIQRGRIANIDTQVKLEDAKALQEQLAKGAERFYQFGLYVTLTADNEEELNHLSKQVQSTLGALLIVAKPASLVMEEAFKTTQPFGQDLLNITRNMDTTSLATTFPFTSSELTANEGILYGINEHNDSLVIFDRFSMENANMCLFAKSGSGKSTASWEKTLIMDAQQNVKLLEIGQFIDDQIAYKGKTQIDEEMEGVINPGFKALAFDKDLKVRWATITVAARKKFSPRNKLYLITTTSGRKITVTADHNLVVMRNGRIRVMRSEAVKISERVPLPRFLPESTANFSLPTEYLTLLGLITSEGLIYEKFVRIFNTDPTVLSIIKNALTTLKVKHYPLSSRGKQVGFSSNQRFATKVITDGAGGRSGKKRVPPLVFSLSNEQIACYLRAYYEGDGGVEQCTVSATTKSKDLSSDLAYLLLRFGIIARVHEREKAATNTTRRIKRTYYQITITGKDQIQAFVDHIGFLTPAKNKKLADMLRRRGVHNTNVDTIPGLQPVFRSLYRALYPTAEIKAPQTMIAIKNGVYQPSREQLAHVISLCEDRIRELRSLEPYIKLLRELPSVSRLIRLGSKSKVFNHILWEKLGDSWRNIKRFLHPPLTQNVLVVYQTVSGKMLTAPLLASTLYSAFKQQGVSLREYNGSLWNAVVLKKSNNPQYNTIFKAAKFIARKYRSTQLKIRHAQEKLTQLKVLAKSDLFWDPIVSIERIKHRERYVYDLQVDNGVFLAGEGGMFVHNSYMVKLEALRSLMFDTEVIAIDPEDEYRRLCEAVRGQYIEFSFSSKSKINPFDLPHLKSGGENELSQKLLSLHSLMKIMLGEMDPTQEAMLDRALVASYKAKGITPSVESQNNEPPLLEDLYKALVGMEDPQAANLAARLEKYVKGSFRGLFDQRTNVDLSNEFTVFGIKNLEDELRPVAMFMILDFIWTRVKSELRRRLLIVDEAWYLMKHQDSAMFLYSIAKRARKYYLGLTTITQDVEDFLHSDYGKAIVTNSSIQVLLKQSAAAIDIIQEVFYLSEGEKQLLLAAEIGEGLFFAGQNHVAMKVIASDDEHKLITSKPQEILEMQRTAPPIPPLQPAMQNTLKTPTGEEFDNQISRQSDKQANRQTDSQFIHSSDNPIIRSPGIPSVPSVPKISSPTPLSSFASPVPTPTPTPTRLQPPAATVVGGQVSNNQKPITRVQPTVEYTSIFENPPGKHEENDQK